MADTEWEAKVKGLLKAELKRRNVSYAQLAEKLSAIGVVDSEPNIRNKLSRGKFTGDRKSTRLNSSRLVSA